MQIRKACALQVNDKPGVLSDVSITFPHVSKMSKALLEFSCSYILYTTDHYAFAAVIRGCVEKYWHVMQKIGPSRQRLH